MEEKWGNEGSQRLLVNETSYVVQANTEGSLDRIHHSVFRFIHETVVHDASSSFKVAMTETDWMSLVVEQKQVRC